MSSLIEQTMTMKNCDDCKYAEWKRCSNGRLHPSGDGKCTYPWKQPKLPASMYWIGFSELKPSGGFISRKSLLSEDCVYFTKHDNL